LDPLIKSQLLYQLSYAPDARLQVRRAGVLYQSAAALSSGGIRAMPPGVGPAARGGSTIAREVGERGCASAAPRLLGV
jgi:hypothetical protein